MNEKNKDLYAEFNNFYFSNMKIIISLLKYRNQTIAKY